MINIFYELIRFLCNIINDHKNVIILSCQLDESLKNIEMLTIFHYLELGNNPRA